MASPIHIAGILIAIGGVFNCIAGYIKSNSSIENEAPVFELTKPPKSVKTVS